MLGIQYLLVALNIVYRYCAYEKSLIKQNREILIDHNRYNEIQEYEVCPEIY